MTEEELTFTVRLTSNEVTEMYSLLEKSIPQYEEEAKLAEEELKKACNEEEKESALKWKEYCLECIATEKTLLDKITTKLSTGA